MKAHIIAIVIFSLLLFSCEHMTEPFTDTPIVESYLTPGEHPVVKITRQIPFAYGVSYSNDDISSLQVNLSFGNETHLLSYDPSDTSYTNTGLTIVEGIKYNLGFTFNSKNVTACTTVPSKPKEFKQSVTSISLTRMDSTSGPPQFGDMPYPVELTWSNPDTSYYILVIRNIESTLDPIRSFGTRTPPGNMFRERPTASSGISLRPMEFQYFGRHMLILYHVLPDYASLYENRISSSQNLTNPSTSIVNGYGIFTGLNADTLYLDVNEAKK